MQIGKLTPKQEKIAQLTAQQILTTGETNQTRIGLEVFNTDNANSARVMAQQELHKPAVMERVRELLDNAGLSEAKTSENLAFIANLRDVKFSGDQVLKANLAAAKFFNWEPDKKTIHARFDFKTRLNNLDFKDLKASLSEIRSENDDFSEDIV